MRFFPFLAIALFPFLLSSCYVWRYFSMNVADVDDYKKMRNDSLVPTSPSKVDFKSSPENNTDFLENYGKLIYKNEKFDLLNFLEENKTNAFIVIKGDSILFEKYFGEYDRSTVHTSFSISKSFVGLLYGIALHEGKIDSLQEPIGNYLSSYTNSKYDSLRIIDLLNMRSGLKTDENYFLPTSRAVKIYFGENMKKATKGIGFKGKKEFEYLSLNTQLLGLILEKRYDQNLAQLFNDKIWSKVTNDTATWGIDQNGNTRAFCCFQARPIDYGRIGKLVLQKGELNKRQIVPADYLDSVYQPIEKQPWYNLQWWHNVVYVHKENGDTLAGGKIPLVGFLDQKKKYNWYPQDDLYARGLYGQFIYLYPKKDIIILRFGDKTSGVYWPYFLLSLARSIN